MMPALAFGDLADTPGGHLLAARAHGSPRAICRRSCRQSSMRLNSDTEYCQFLMRHVHCLPSDAD